MPFLMWYGGIWMHQQEKGRMQLDGSINVPWSAVRGSLIKSTQKCNETAYHQTKAPTTIAYSLFL